tara:strand:+ start:211535 stop:212971 length:1437 start_codon:yes stop_codon:yes gene_type:complete
MSDNEQSTPEQTERSLKPIQLFICLAIGLTFWFSPAPNGLEVGGWHVLGLFVTTILALVIKPLPMGAVALISLEIAILTNLITAKQGFSAFSSTVVWLVLFALFIAKGFNVTGLSKRIAYFFTAIFGKKTLGLSYGLMLTDLILAPAIPSVTGRAAGIVFPIVRSIATSYKSFPNCSSSKKIGGFLTVTAFQVTTITSAMFMTAMAANPLIAKLTADQSIALTWGKWALAAIVPGIISLAVIPWFIFKIYPPSIRVTPNATILAKQNLKDMGKISRSEWIMGFTVIVLLTLWMLNKYINPAVAGMVGLTVLLVSGVLEWKSLVKIDTAWETFFWFCIIIMLAGQLTDQGVLSWFTTNVEGYFSDYHWTKALPIICLIYFYIHYFFASSTAHVSAMFPAFLGLAIVLGAPPLLAVFVLTFASNLFGGLTHYSLAPAPLLYGVGYVDIKDWWRIGFLVSLINIAIWCGIGIPWWKFLGYW